MRPEVDLARLSETEIGVVLRQLRQESFIDFVRFTHPWFLVEGAHLAIAEYLEALERGEPGFDRVMFFLCPRTGKSLTCSTLFPAWYIGKNYEDRIMHVSHSTNLSEDWGGDIREAIAAEDYQEVFPGIELVKDTKAKAKWRIKMEGAQRPGEYRGAGTRTNIAGKGFNLGIIDDPTSEQDAYSPVTQERTFRWYESGFYTRRQPEKNAIIIIQTRWTKADLSGRLLEKAKNQPDADQWKVLDIPAILDKRSVRIIKAACNRDALFKGADEYKVGGSFMPRRMPLKEIMRSKANMSSKDFAAQYMQQPVEDEGHILKRRWWRMWPGDKPPRVDMIVQCYDTAFEEDEQNDFSARTTWGIFRHATTNIETGREYEHYHCILLERWAERVQAAELKRLARQAYRAYRPDLVLIEKRASGHQLIQELRKLGLPIKAWLPPGPRGAKGKVPRYNAASIPLEQGAVWYMPRKWADDVINQCADAPFGTHDDLADTCSIAWLYLRQRFHLDMYEDEPDEDEWEEWEIRQRARAGQSRRLYGNLH